MAYFGKMNRERHFLMLVAWDNMKRWPDETNALTKLERKYLRMASSLLLKVSDSIVERIGQEYAQTLLKEANGSDLYARRKNQTIESFELAIDREDLWDISSYALAHCDKCNVCNHEDCPLFQVMQRVGIPVADENPVGCPYKQ